MTGGRGVSFNMPNEQIATYEMQDGERLRFIEILDNVRLIRFPSSFVNCAACGDLIAKCISKRCARCEVPFYCDSDCQKTHWKQGGHKAWCIEKNDLILTGEGRQTDITIKHSRKMRKLLRHLF